MPLLKTIFYLLILSTLTLLYPIPFLFLSLFLCWMFVVCLLLYRAKVGDYQVGVSSANVGGD